MRTTMTMLLALGLLFTATEALAKKHQRQAPPAEAAAPAAEAAPMRYPARLDFTDPRLVQGQRNGAGSVYLYDRKQLELRSMVKQRESFRDQISL